jgi:hypothetical protein
MGTNRVTMQPEDQWRALTLERIDSLISSRVAAIEKSSEAGLTAEADAEPATVDPKVAAEERSAKAVPVPATDDRAGLLRLVMVLGVILAVSSAISPWYISGGLSDVDMSNTRVTFQTMGGWSAFPGLPLMLIIVGSAVSAVLTIAGAGAQGYRVVSMAAALVSLFSATWLWYGLVGSLPSGGESFVAQETGPMLVTIGSIVLVGVGAIRIRALSHR